MLPEFKASTEFDRRKSEIDSFNMNNRWKKRGIGIIAMKYDHGFMGHYPAIVTIHHVDGTVAISHGAIEMGQGVNTKVVQVAAATLGIPVDKVRVKPTNNLATANSTVSGGSLASDSASVVSICIKRVNLLKKILNILIVLGCIGCMQRTQCKNKTSS